jgi:hypothetical protein
VLENFEIAIPDPSSPFSVASYKKLTGFLKLRAKNVPGVEGAEIFLAGAIANIVMYQTDF